jgi:SAM-dependent methyltransferase
LIKKLLSANRDPVGDVYIVDGKILRGIRIESAQYFQDILNYPAVKAMLGNKIIETGLAEKPLDGYAITFEHPFIAPQNYCYEWPLVMFQDAALLTLDICIELNSVGAVLKDASPWNIFYRGPQPILVDLTSIRLQEKDLLWVAYNQFICQFLFPLLVGYYTNGKTTRSLMLASQNGISENEVSQFLPASANIKYPWLLSRLVIPKTMMKFLRSTGQEKEFVKIQQKASYTTQARQAFFVSLRKDIDTLQFKSKGSLWSKYYQDINAFFEPEHFHDKQRSVAEFLQQTKPKTVVDIGCNLGGYSFLAAQAGARVTSFDTDEDSVAMLYRLAKEKQLDIAPFVADVIYPPTQSGWRAEEFASAPVRFRSEMALALALIHHLAISQNLTFERIVATLSDYCDKYLITEFVPLDDPRSQELLLTSRRDMSWYLLDAFVDELKKEFRTVKIVPSFPAGRTLCFCEK